MKNDRRVIKEGLARNMKRYRACLRLTQEEAAERAGITAKYWQRLEMISQADLPSLPALLKIAKGLEIPLWRLFRF